MPTEISEILLKINVSIEIHLGYFFTNLIVTKSKIPMTIEINIMTLSARLFIFTSAIMGKMIAAADMTPTQI